MNKRIKLLTAILSFFWVSAAIGQGNALNFDGIDDYVDLDVLTPSLAGANDLTVEFWIKANGGQQNTMLFAINSQAQAGGNILLIGLNGGSLSINDANGNVNIPNNPIVADGGCHHIAYVKTGNTAVIYLDGLPITPSGGIPAPGTLQANYQYSLGSEIDYPAGGPVYSQYYTGDLDEIKIWNTARNQSEVGTDMDDYSGTAHAGLIALYDCNQGTPGANNTNEFVTGLTDLVGGLNGTISPTFSLTGQASNFVANSLQTIQLTVFAPDTTPCTNDAVWISGGPLNSGITGLSWTTTTSSTVIGTGWILPITPPDATYVLNGTAGACVTVLPAQISINYSSSPNLSTTLNSPLCEGSPISISASASTSPKCVSASWQWYETYNNVTNLIQGQTGSQLSIPVNNYPVGTEFSVELCCGASNVCCTTVIAGKMAPYPILSFPPVAPIDICNWNGQNIQLNASGTGINCSYTSSSPGMNTQTGEFNPIVGGVGQHFVSYQCEIAGCETFAAQSITVTDNGNWHQTTENTLGKESANDVITDEEGNVYVTGEYEVRTTLNGGGNSSVTMGTGTGAPEKHSYTAKYDDCANLIWVNYSTSQHAGAYNYGTSITLDEIGGYVYCVGNYEPEMNYVGPFGSGPLGAYSQKLTSSSGTSTQEGYVVRMSMLDGTLHYLEPVEVGKLTELRSITVNENTGDIFVGGHKNGPIDQGEDRAFINKYTPNNNGIDPVVWQIIDIQDGNSYINDLDFNENQGNGGLWTIGEYDQIVQFSGQSNSSMTIVNNNFWVMDAFVSFHEDGNGAPQENYVIKGNSDGLMTGRGIAVDEDNGFAYVTGSYEGSIGEPFELGGYSLTNNATSNAYFVALDDNANSPWSDARYAEADEIEAKGVAVSFKNELAYFTGTYSFETTFDGSSQLTLPYSAAGGTAGNEHVYLVSYDSNGEPVWVNGTEDPNSNTAVHLPTSVAADNYGHAFIVGSYSEDLGYIQGNPASGVLTSTGNQAPNINAFILRSDLGNNGAFKNVAASEEAQVIIDKRDINISLAPNPTSHQTTLTVADFDSELNYSFVVYGIDGKIMCQGKIDANGAILDLEAFQAGVYFVQVSNGTEMELAKILKVE